MIPSKCYVGLSKRVLTSYQKTALQVSTTSTTRSWQRWCWSRLKARLLGSYRAEGEARECNGDISMLSVDQLLEGPFKLFSFPTSSHLPNQCSLYG